LLASNELAGASSLETLLSATMSFHLGHGISLSKMIDG